MAQSNNYFDSFGQRKTLRTSNQIRKKLEKGKFIAEKIDVASSNACTEIKLSRTTFADFYEGIYDLERNELLDNVILCPQCHSVFLIDKLQTHLKMHRCYIVHQEQLRREEKLKKSNFGFGVNVSEGAGAHVRYVYL